MKGDDACTNRTAAGSRAGLIGSSRGVQKRSANRRQSQESGVLRGRRFASRRGVQPILPTPKTAAATSDNVRYVMLIIKKTRFFGGKFTRWRPDALVAIFQRLSGAAADFGRSSLPRRTFAARRTIRADVRSTARCHHLHRADLVAGCSRLQSPFRQKGPTVATDTCMSVSDMDHKIDPTPVTDPKNRCSTCSADRLAQTCSQLAVQPIQ